MENKIRELSNANRRKRLLKRVVAFLSIVVLLFTVNSLKLTAITLSRVPACGLKKHIHKAKCYDGNGNLICGKVEHQHTDACYQVAPNDLTLEIEGDGVAVDEPSLDLSLSLDDGVLQVDDSALQLDDSLLELDNPPVDDAGSGGQTNTSQKPTYELGEKAKLSKIIKKTKLGVSIDEVNEVGVVDYDGTQASLLSIEQIDGDYIIAAARDFDETDLAIIAEKGIEVVRLVGGRMPAEVVEQTDPQTSSEVAEETDVQAAEQNPSEAAEQGDVQTDVQATEETDPQIDVQTDLQAGAESTEDEISSDIVVDDQVAVDDFNGGESDALALDLDDAVVVQQQDEEAPVEEQGREAPAEDQGGIIVIEAEVPTDEQGEETPAEEQVCEVETPADVQGEEPPADAQDEEPPAEEQAGDVEAPADTQADEEEQSIQQSDMDEVAVEAQDGGIEVEAPADIQGVETPVDVQGVEAPVEEQGGVEAPVDVQGDDDEALAEEQGVEGPVDMQGVEASADVQGVETPADVQGDDDEALTEEQGVEAPADTQSGEEDQSVQQSDQVEALVEEQADEQTDEQADEVEQSVQQSDMDEVAADTQVEEEEQADEEETLTDAADEAPAEEEDQADEEEQAAEEENASEEDVEAEEEQPTEEDNASEGDEEAVDEEEQPAEEEQADESAEEEQADEAAEEEQADETAEEEQADEEEQPTEEELSGEAPAATIYSATIDLSEVETYPISLMEIMAKAVLSDAAEEGTEAEAAAADEEAEATVETAEAEAAEEEANAAEVSAWTIEYDTSLFSIEAVEDDYLITPIQSFERTQIIVTNDSRYELTLVNCVLADESKDETVEQEAAFVYVATIDLTDVEAYPLSLNEMMSAARAEQPDEEQAQEQAQDAQPDETEEQTQDEQPALNIEYDENLLSTEIVGDDHLITPVQSFERTVITVESDGRYELTLVNCALTEVAEAGEAEAFPAQDFEGQTDYIRVVVSAPAGAFPAGTTMKVVDVADEKTLTDIEDTVSEEFVEVRSVHAVDITFTDVDGNEIEPLVPISVVMSLVESEQIQKAETVVVHVDDEGATQVVESESAGEAVVSMEMSAGEQQAADNAADNSTEESEGDAEAESEAFQADSFSIYAMVQTEAIETRYIAADGTTWNISVGYGKEAEIPAGASLAVSEVVGEDAEAYLAQTAEALRGKETITLARFFDITILDSEGQEVQPKAAVEVHASLTDGTQDTVKAVHFAEEGPEIIEASQDDEAVVFEAEGFSVYGIVYTVDFHYGVDGQTYEFTLPGGGAVGMRELAPALGLVEDGEDAIDLFVENIEGIAFSDEELVKPVPVEMNMTVGALKQKFDLESEYSAELTEVQVAELNDKVLQAPDWALVSLKPFDTEETLTITMKNGEVITVAVTDAQLSREVITASGETYVITVTYGDDAQIPEGAELKVREILPEDDEYADYLAQAKKAVSGEASADEAGEDMDAGEEAAEANGEGEYARFFDIEIWANEQKVEPAALVTVDIALADAPVTEEELKVVHFDEADGPVVMPTQIPEAPEDDATQRANVRFETDGFSVYGVVTVPTAPSGISDLNGRAFTISYNNHYMTSEVITTTGDQNYDNVQRMKKSDKAGDAAQWHFEAVNAGNGEYKIWTFVGDQKKYLNIDRITGNAWEGNADVVLRDTPQIFKAEKNGNYYNISAQAGEKTYYINEHYGDLGDAFAAYTESDGNSLLTLEFNPVTKDVDQYMLVTKYGGEYYVVLNDGRLEKAESVSLDESGNIVAGNFTTPMTWTWDGHHLFHNSVAVGYTGDQRASDFYRRYIDPQSGNGLAQEHGRYLDDGTNVDTADDLAQESSRVVLVTVEANAGHGKYTYKTVYDRTGAMDDAAFDVTRDGDKISIHKSGSYLGVAENNGTLTLTGNITDQSAAGDFWLVDLNKVSGKSYVILEKVKNPEQERQYYVIIKEKYSDTYHIVYPDRSLSAGQVGMWDNTMSFEAPDKMYLWTYDYSQIYTNDGSEPWAHLDPKVLDGIRKINTATKVTVESDGSIHGEDGEYFTIVNNVLGGGVSQEEERKVFLARLVSAGDMQYLDSGVLAEMNHMVNHIDIGIIGSARLTLPLAYGTYKYKNALTGEWETYTVSSEENIELIENVDITKEDIKQGTIQAYVKDPETNQTTYRDDLFTITGYSANQETPISHDQVRIEGNFKVADLDPVSEADRDTAETRAARIANKVYYTVSTTKPVKFQFIHEDFGQLYDMEGNPLSVTVDVNMSASFNYWDWKGPEGTQGNNECPPLQPSWSGGTFSKWQGGDGKGQGGIPADGNSGMDFVLGGDAGDDNSNVVALNITKIVEDTHGNRITLATPMTNTFNVYYGKNVDENTVINVNRDACTVADPQVYTGYGANPLHSKSITVGRDGIAIIYDYDVSEGMIYITEDKDTVPARVTDENGEIYDYHHTVIKTEYVWRTDADNKSTRHVSKDFTKEDAEFRAIPEKLGSYHLENGTTIDSRGKPLRNGFLDFYVYNVYEPQKINLEIQKKWKQDGDFVTAPVNVNISAHVGRYKLQQDTSYTPKGKLTIEDSFSGIDSSQYHATYTVTGPNGYSETFACNNFNISGDTLTKTLTGLWGGSYRVTKTVEPVSGYTHSPARYSTSVPVPMTGENTVVLKKTGFYQNTDQLVRVSVAIDNALNQDLAHPEDYAPGISMNVNANSTITFSYDVFHSDGWNRDVDANWYVYEWKTGDSGSEATTYRWRQVGEVHALHAQNASIQVGTNPICLRIDYPNPNEAYKMNIVVNGTAITSGAVSGGDPSGDPEEDPTDDGSAQPESLIEGMVYLPEEGWTRTVTLNNSSWDSAINSWKAQVEEAAGKYDFDRYDENGNEYIYYIQDLNEEDPDIPQSTRCLPFEYSTRVDPDTGKNTFICIATNEMPSSMEITIRKVNSQNTSELLTAGFELQKYTDDGFSTQDPDWTPRQMTVNGTVKVENLGVGYYKLVETSWPVGYVQVSADPRFQVYIDDSSREVKVNFLGSSNGTVSFESSNNTFTVTNTPKGALKLTKVVTVNDEAPTTDAQKALTNGIFAFSIVGSDAATSGDNHNVRISFNNGKANGYEIDGTTIGATGIDNQYGVIVSGLTPGRYTVTETDSDNPMMMFKSVTGGNNDAKGRSITLTVVAGDVAADSASAQVVYTNNRDVVDIDATKTWKDDKGEQINHIVNDASVTFELQKKVGDVWSKVELEGLTNPQTMAVTNAANADAWKAEWHSLPKYDGSVLIQYRVVETAATFMDANVKPVTDPVAGITIEANTRSVTVNIDNTLPTTDISVTKLWKDGTVANEDRVFSEAKQINFTLYQKLGIAEGQPYKENNVAIVGQVTYTPAANGNPASWSTWTLSKLPRFVYDETSQAWTAASYYVVEDVLNGVKVTYQKGNDTAVEKAENAMVTEADDDRKITIINKDIPVDLNILKVDANDMTKPLAGAQFELCCVDETNASIQTETKKQAGPTGSEGKTAFTGLVSGYYMVEETVVPEGYILTSSRRFYIKVDIGATTDQIQLVDWNSAQQKWAPRAADPKLTFETETSTVKVGNEPGASLPATGGPGTALYYAAGSALLLLAIATLIFRKKADDE